MKRNWREQLFQSDTVNEHLRNPRTVICSNLNYLLLVLFLLVSEEWSSAQGLRMMSSDQWDTIKLEQNGKNRQTTPILCSGLDKIPAKKAKPLGERRKAVWRQQLMVFLGNTGVMGAGMAVALPSVTLGQLSDENEEFSLSLEEASWFCMYFDTTPYHFDSEDNVSCVCLCLYVFL